MHVDTRHAACRRKSVRSLSYSSHPFKPEQLILWHFGNVLCLPFLYPPTKTATIVSWCSPRLAPNPGSPCVLFPTVRSKLSLTHLVRRGAFSSRVLQGGRTQIGSDIDFCGIKNRNIDISMFLFCQNYKKCHFWQFIAPFGSQLRQIAF